METMIEVGGFVLEPGNPAGTGIRREGGAAGADAASLREALAGTPPEPEQPPALVTDVEEASEATAKIERAVALSKGIAEGRALDPAQLGLEVSTLLDCLERLDRKGKHKKSLQMARALTSLLMLLKRWADLLRALRIALRAGNELGDQAAVAWAKHELGTLRLAGGDVAGADRELGEACEIRRQIDDRRGLAASQRNMQVLCEQLRAMVRDEELVRPLRGRPPALRLSMLLLLAVLFAAGLGAGVLAAGGDGGGTGTGGGPGDDTDTSNGNGKPSNYELVITIAGDGGGSVEGGGLTCDEGICPGTVRAGEILTFVAEEYEDSIFEGFSGSCPGTEKSCKLTATGPVSVTATFGIKPGLPSSSSPSKEGGVTDTEPGEPVEPDEADEAEPPLAESPE